MTSIYKTEITYIASRPFNNLFHCAVSCTCRMLQTVRGDEALVISQLAQDWGLRERQSDRPVATPHRRTKIFSVFTRDCRTLCRPKSRIPSVPRESPLKRRPNEPTRAQNSAAVPFVPAMCFTFSLFASGRPFFLVLPPLFSLSPFLHPLTTRIVDERTEENA